MSSYSTTSDVCDAYHRWYYEGGLWERTTFAGVPAWKSVSDMWNYQEIIHGLTPSLIVEFGTSFGGSTLFFSTILKMVSPTSRVLSVDSAPHMVVPQVRDNAHIECMTALTTDARVATRLAELRNEFPGPVFAILDSDHHASHVIAEMRLLRPLLRPGDYLVVEDSNINGHPVLPGWGAGPLEALLEYERDYPDDYIRDVEREFKFGFTFAPRGFLIRR